MYYCGTCSYTVDGFQPGGGDKFCHRCQQPGFKDGTTFVFCGDRTKQCGVCGKKWPANRCAWCYKIFNGMHCYACGRENVGAKRSMSSYPPKSDTTATGPVTLPFAYTGEDGNTYHLLGWKDATRLRIQCCEAGAPEITLNSGDSMSLLRWLDLTPENIPQKKKSKVKTISKAEWEMFLRFRESLPDLRECASTNLSNWRDHVKYLEDEYADYNNEDYEDQAEEIRRMARLLKYVTDGEMPPDDVDDEDLEWEDDGFVAPRYQGPRGRQVVKVQIIDISTGDL